MKPDLHRDAKARAALERVWLWLRFGDVNSGEAALRKRVADDQLRDFRREVGGLSPTEASSRVGLVRP